MKGLQRFLFQCALIVLTVSVSFSCAAQEVNKWDRAGEKMKEASHAVGEATEESTRRAVEEAHKAWEDAKRKYQEAVDAAKKKYDEEIEKARAQIHEVTAPKDAAEPDRLDVSEKSADR
jgi:F0F1-type ATP synthase membrane subunit b/b'